MKPQDAEVVSTFPTENGDVWVLYKVPHNESHYYGLMRIGSDKWDPVGVGGRALAERVEQLEARLSRGPSILYPVGTKPEGYE